MINVVRDDISVTNPLLATPYPYRGGGAMGRYCLQRKRDTLHRYQALRIGRPIEFPSE